MSDGLVLGHEYEPLREGMVRKGGRNEASQFEARPPAPAPLRAPRHENMVNLPFAFGAKVHLDGDDSIKGTVTGFCLYPHGMQIEVAWFANGDAKSAWFAVWRVSEAS